ncbi:MAG: DUF424 family protein [Candidatus Diapherotrites archaeon]
MYAKLHAGGQVLACCDKELAGRILKEGELEFSVSEKFYKDVEVSREQLKEMLQESGNANLVGEKAVQIALELGIIGKNNVKYIQGIPHTIILKL